MTERDPLATQAANLFTFLAKVQESKHRPVTDYSAYERDGQVVFFHSLPQSEHVRQGSPSSEDDGYAVLTIDRLQEQEGPSVPSNLQPWVMGDPTDPSTSLRLVSERRDPHSGEVHVLADHPDVQDRFESWHAEWLTWAEQESAARDVRELYARLFKVHLDAGQLKDRFELELAVGLLTWAPESGTRVRHHVFSVPVTSDLSDRSGSLTFRVDADAIGLSTTFDMLPRTQIADRSLVSDVEEAATGYLAHPLDSDALGMLGSQIVNRLHADGWWDEQLVVPTAGPAPALTFSPALILRPRRGASLTKALRTIAQQVEESGSCPAGLAPLIDPDRLPPVTEENRPGALLTAGAEVISPLPLNQEQLRVLERVDSHAQTLVQGPPGTGKTHTVAALLSHLLAQGQRVLVTAHTEQALHEVRDKLPQQVRPLAVSVTGGGREEMAELQVAVDGLAERSTHHDVQQSARDERRHLETFEELQSQRHELGRQLVDAREVETRLHDHGGTRGTLASFAKLYGEGRQDHAWIQELVPSRESLTSPLRDQEAVEWLGLLRDPHLKESQEEAALPRSSSAELPEPHQFAALVDAEARAQAQVDSAEDALDPQDSATLRGLTEAERASIRAEFRELHREISTTRYLPPVWTAQALDDVRRGAAGVWRGRQEAIRPEIDRVAAFVQRMPPGYWIEAPDADRDRLVNMAKHLWNYLGQGKVIPTSADGTPKIGVFSPAVLKECRDVLELVRVSGEHPVTQGHLALFIDDRDATAALDRLDRAWPADVTVPAEDTLRERFDWHRDQAQTLDRVLAVGDQVNRLDQRLRGLLVTPPDWRSDEAIAQWERGLERASAEHALHHARGPLDSLSRHLVAHGPADEVAGAVQGLAASVDARDPAVYARHHADLIALEATARMLDRRDELRARLAAATPLLCQAVAEDPDDAEWDERLGHLEASIRWVSLGAWLSARENVDINAIQASIGEVERTMRSTAESIATVRAWSHAVHPERLSPARRSDLREYSQLVKKLGKGTGKYAHQQRQAIRRAMDRCRPAVPVWIMPLHKVAEQLGMEENSFDVVIVDEASQAGLEAILITYLARKVVVIGDDLQVSPTSFANRDEVAALAQQYIPDHRYKDSWIDPERSLFDEAEARFGGQLTLVEHRRCMPEIIGFSNRIAYEPRNKRLQPVRQFGSDRIAPWVIHHVEDGAEHGASAVSNPQEARALVDDLLACLEDPRFSELTMGVVTLLGTQQAKLIEGMLLKEVPAEEWEARDLRVGTPADFQGSERDIIFLSMVSAPREARLGSRTKLSDVQRFNVAVSRAKDQVRLFHSLQIQDLTNSEDMRFHLLDYAYGVTAPGRAVTMDGRGVVSDDVRDPDFDSLFEQRVYNRIVERGFTVRPQVSALGYRLDLVVVGSRGQLAIECDGDHWHGREQYQADLARQRDLERCGWEFFRIRESLYYLDPANALAPLWQMLEERGIRPSDWVEETETQAQVATDEPSAGPVVPGGASPEVPPAFEAAVEVDGLAEPDHEPVPPPLAPEAPAEEAPAAEAPAVATSAAAEAPDEDVPGAHVPPTNHVAPGPADSATLPDRGGIMAEYEAFTGMTAPVSASSAEILEGLLQIVAAEGPVRGSRLRSAYVRASGGQKVGKNIRARLDGVISSAQRRGLLIMDNPLSESSVSERTYRLPSQPLVHPRMGGPRELADVPPREIAALLQHLSREHPGVDQESLMRLAIQEMGRKSLTALARARIEPCFKLLGAPADDQEP